MSGAIKKVFTASFLYIGMTAASYGQQAYLKAADEHYNKGDYFGAAQLYEKFLAGKGTVKNEFNPYTSQRTKGAKAKPGNAADASLKLAESYYRLHQFAKAEPLLETAKGKDAGITLLYAQTLKYNGKADQAVTVLTKYIDSLPKGSEQYNQAKLELESINFAKEQLQRKDLQRFTVTRKDGWNTVGATYAPAAMGSQLVVTSTRADSASNPKNPHANKLYAATGGTLEKLSGYTPDADMEQGIASFSPNGNTMYFTKWTLQNGQKVAAIYKSEKQGANWGSPILLDASVNAPNATMRQPYATQDGKYLLFASDRPGGRGKNDIWYIALDAAGNPTGTAVNLEAVNTAGDDEAPFYHQASGTLVYASNGLVGMGGYDLYVAKGSIGSAWAKPKNMGYPVNSVKDDIYYLSTDPKSVWNNAVFSSDRQSECCLELFAFDKLKVKKVISGKVTDCKDGSPVGGASVQAVDANGNTVFTGTTDANGQYSIAMDEFASLQASANSSGYEKGAISIAVPANEDDETLVASAICIKKIEKPVEENKAIVLEDVLYAFNKSTLSKKSYPLFDTLISLMNTYPAMQVEISAHTDNIGSDAYNQKLSDKRAASCVAYLVSKGISADRLIAKGYGETTPVAENKLNGKDNPAGRAKNRRTEFKVLHY
jgi:OOP family OmpA-OmpF porin